MTMRDMKSLPDRDPARTKLASAIALEAGARRDLRVAEDAASLAANRHWDAQSNFDELSKVVAAPIGALANTFAASVSAGVPCDVATLDRSAVNSRAKIKAAENEVAVWDQTRRECELAVRVKDADVVNARERVDRCARVVICNSENIAHLIDELAALQGEIIK